MVGEGREEGDRGDGNGGGGGEVTCGGEADGGVTI